MIPCQCLRAHIHSFHKRLHPQKPLCPSPPQARPEDATTDYFRALALNASLQSELQRCQGELADARQEAAAARAEVAQATPRLEQELRREQERSAALRAAVDAAEAEARRLRDQVQAARLPSKAMVQPADVLLLRPLTAGTTAAVRGFPPPQTPAAALVRPTAMVPAAEDSIHWEPLPWKTAGPALQPVQALQLQPDEARHHTRSDPAPMAHTAVFMGEPTVAARRATPRLRLSPKLRAAEPADAETAQHRQVAAANGGRTLWPADAPVLDVEQLSSRGASNAGSESYRSSGTDRSSLFSNGDASRSSSFSGSRREPGRATRAAQNEVLRDMAEFNTRQQLSKISEQRAADGATRAQSKAARKRWGVLRNVLSATGVFGESGLTRRGAAAAKATAAAHLQEHRQYEKLKV